MIDCATFDAFIVDFIEGTLPWRQKAVFSIHLRMCRECREYLADYKSAMAVAAQQKDVPFSGMNMGDVPEDLIEAISAALQNSSKT